MLGVVQIPSVIRAHDLGACYSDSCHLRRPPSCSCESVISLWTRGYLSWAQTKESRSMYRNETVFCRSGLESGERTRLAVLGITLGCSKYGVARVLSSVLRGYVRDERQSNDTYVPADPWQRVFDSNRA
ncbi:hypothetical protein PUNSTDRAFT_52023 [Punctularia strigosozonata HHB-11173 SS5]|uniref:uncharacterized protein n=1 Tax=Punctularia strigosozonata (strain HHB-11173) TaxID=741275 RepID=UPI0004417565|nr:uncharacterized protein PUNSTDRAFT_52023 [Punctularia strigosozonata HHB-11173 SS5]EIN09839.1 hypothetical protein PUNSTDRAFT_52023 [Punctularia strigosozonata HHB-11173 SS5]